MTTISNFKIEGDSSVNFCWRWTKLNDQWNQQTEIFAIDESKRLCTLNLLCSAYCGELFYFSFKIYFAELDPYYEDRYFELTVFFHKNLSSGYSFKLFKDKENAMIFKSDNPVIRFPYYGCSSVDTYIKLISSKKSAESKLLQDIKQILHDDLSDMKLVAKDRIFQVHKCILAARSKVFDKMINTNMIEKETSEIKLVEWSSTVVKELLNYVYTSTCEMKNIAHDLFRLAHYLEMIELQSLCKSYLQSTVSVENIVPTIKLTNEGQFELNDLKKVADTFVSTNIENLVKDEKYLEYLSNTVSLDNITDILALSKKYNIEKLLSQAMEFVCLHYTEVLFNEKCKSFFLNETEMLMNILKYSLEEGGLHGSSETENND